MTQLANIKIMSVVGVVAGTARWSETKVTSSGGSTAYISPLTNTAFISRTKIHSEVTERRSFFLHTFEGRDIELQADAFPARDGHRVTAIYAASDRHPELLIVGMHNYDTGQTLVFDQRVADVAYAMNKTMAVASVIASIVFFPLAVVAIWHFMKERKREDADRAELLRLIHLKIEKGV